jgi:hypothetical protein
MTQAFTFAVQHVAYALQFGNDLVDFLRRSAGNAPDQLIQFFGGWVTLIDIAFFGARRSGGAYFSGPDFSLSVIVYFSAASCRDRLAAQQLRQRCALFGAAENLRLGLVALDSIGAWICCERTALNSAGDNWMRCCFRDRAAFPRSDGFDYDSDPSQRALDFTLHFFNLGI